MKGIILAGGAGSRLHPVTIGVSKQILPVYDKPMIYYPLSVLMLAKIQDILIITTPEDQASFIRTLGDGRDFGINIEYRIQPKPEGLAQAFIIGDTFIGNDNCALVLGDNIFYGYNMRKILSDAVSKKDGATVFGYWVANPESFGVIGFDHSGKVTSIEEKPKTPKSNYAVTGLYFYDNKVIDIAKSIKPSDRGELEITTVNQIYLNNSELDVKIFERGYAWLDTGTHESLMEAGQFIRTIEHRQGIKIACLEEIAYENGWIDVNSLENRANFLSKTEYGKYLYRIIEDKR